MRLWSNILAAPLRIFRGTSKALWFMLLLASLAFNVAALTLSGVHAVASAALSATGLTTVAAREASARQIDRKAARDAHSRALERARRDATRRANREAAQRAQQQAADTARRNTARKIGRDTTQRVTARVQRGAARNVSSVAGEAIPFVGLAVIVGALAMEIDDACDTAKDMAGLEAALATTGDPEAAKAAAEEAFDCRAIIPDYDDLPDRSEIWARMRAAPGAVYDEARNAGISLSEIDWSGYALRTVNWVARQMDGLSEIIFPDPDPDQERQR